MAGFQVNRGSQEIVRKSRALPIPFTMSTTLAFACVRSVVEGLVLSSVLCSDHMSLFSLEGSGLVWIKSLNENLSV